MLTLSCCGHGAPGRQYKRAAESIALCQPNTLVILFLIHRPRWPAPVVCIAATVLPSRSQFSNEKRGGPFGTPPRSAVIESRLAITGVNTCPSRTDGYRPRTTGQPTRTSRPPVSYVIPGAMLSSPSWAHYTSNRNIVKSGKADNLSSSPPNRGERSSLLKLGPRVRAVCGAQGGEPQPSESNTMTPRTQRRGAPSPNRRFAESLTRARFAVTASAVSS